LNSIPVRFPCGDITLEGEWLFPDGKGPYPGVVVSHPYPPNGGSMQSSVITAIWQALARDSIAAFRFNFRGVGESEGSFGEGVAEREDVKAALDFAIATEGIDNGKIGLAGYSFGAMMSVPVAVRDERVAGLALVSAPLSDDNWKRLESYDKPGIFIIGENDRIVSLELFRKQMENSTDPGQYRIIPGSDHFLDGYEEEVGSIVSRFFADIFK